MTRLVSVFALSVFLVLFISTSGWATTFDPNATNSLNPNYNNPGARSNAMGGAFIGLADDATAAYSNPAGLVVLTKPEFAFEYTYRDSKLVNYDYGSGFKREFDYNYSGPSFISFSYPIPSQNANITIYRHELLNNDVNYTVYQKVPGLNALAITNVNSKSTLTTYAIAGAIKLNNNFSVGFSVGFNEKEFSASSNHLSSLYTVDSYVSGSDWASSYSASFLWTPHELFHLGAVYKYGPKFKNSVGLFTQNGTTSKNYFYPDSSKTPDRLGVGISSRPLNGLTLTADFVYVWYSQMMDDAKFVQGTTSWDYGDSGTLYASDYKIDDTYEIHVGAEYAFTFKIPMAVRAGYAYKPDHRAYLETSTLTGSIKDNFMKASPHGDDEHVFSGGLGFVFKNFQLDFAYSHSDFNTNYIGSLVWRF